VYTAALFMLASRAPLHPPLEVATPSHVSTRGWNARLPLAALLAVLALGAFTRLHALGAESVWFDEAITFRRARLSVPELMSSSLYKMHVPTYFLFMREVLAFGDDEWMLRFPSALFGTLKIGVVAAAGWVVGGAPVGLTAALLLVLAPAHVHYDQEARMYALQTFALSIALLGQLWLTCHPQAATDCWLRNKSHAPRDDAAGAARRGKLAWTAWLLGSVTALYLHNTSALFLVASSAAALALMVADPANRKRFLWHWVAANVAMLLAWSPWLPSLLSQLNKPQFATQVWGGRVGWNGLVEQIRYVLLGGKSPWVNGIVIGLSIAGAWRLRGRPALLAALLVLSLSAPLLLFAISLAAKPMFMPRLMLWGTASACVLAGCGMLAVRRPWLRALVLLTLTALGLMQLQKDYVRQSKVDWRGVAQILSKYEGPRAVALAPSFMQAVPVEYYQNRTTAPIRLPRIEEVRHIHSGRVPRLLGRRIRTVLFFYPGKLPREQWPPAIRVVAAQARRVARVELRGAIVEHYELDGPIHE
jgi:hypothetical protein